VANIPAPCPGGSCAPDAKARCWRRNKSATHNPNNRGSHSDSAGKYVTNINTANITL
jgi:hypothetical protein